MSTTPPPITPAKVIITTLLLIAAGCSAGLFMTQPGSAPFLGLLAGAVVAGAGAMAVPMKPR
jgi:hypothetical protein